MERGFHVDAGEVPVGAAEGDVLRAGVGIDRTQEVAQRHAAPLADYAPALDADKACDLALLRQRA